MTDDKQQLRKTFRKRRRELDIATQEKHAWMLASRLKKLPLFRNSRRIAAYLPEDGEIDPGMVIEAAWQMKKQVFLPILPPTGHALFFAPYTADTLLKPNRFGIAEPDLHPSQWISARQIGLILMPLVAFDTDGHRLGMGGGYYDRSLMFTRHRKQWHSPHLIGLAHDIQKAERLVPEPWDIPLNLIATEAGVYTPTKNN